MESGEEGRGWCERGGSEGVEEEEGFVFAGKDGLWGVSGGREGRWNGPGRGDGRAGW